MSPYTGDVRIGTYIYKKRGYRISNILSCAM